MTEVTEHRIGNRRYQHRQGIGYTDLYRDVADSTDSEPASESGLKPTRIRPINKESRPAQEWLRLADKAGA